MFCLYISFWMIFICVSKNLTYYLSVYSGHVVHYTTLRAPLTLYSMYMEPSRIMQWATWTALLGNSSPISHQPELVYFSNIILKHLVTLRVIWLSAIYLSSHFQKSSKPPHTYICLFNEAQENYFVYALLLNLPRTCWWKYKLSSCQTGENHGSQHNIRPFFFWQGERNKNRSSLFLARTPAPSFLSSLGIKPWLCF